MIEQDPFALIEAMTIAGFADGCEHGYIYLRGEYPLALGPAGRTPSPAARTRGLLGDDIMGHGLRFDIELRKGAGAYICGEETALFNSIEGFRGEPRNKPPFPVDVGLFGKPTVRQQRRDAGQRARTSSRRAARRSRPPAPSSRRARASSACPAASSGRACTRRRSAATLGDVIDLAGGVAGGRELRAILLGGAAGAFVGPDMLDLRAVVRGHPCGRRDARLGRDHAARRHGRSGAHPAADRRLLPRRVVRPVRALPRRHGAPAGGAAAAGERPPAGHRRRRAGAAGRDRAQAMRDASICGLGQTAASAIESALRTLRPFAEEGVA